MNHSYLLSSLPIGNKDELSKHYLPLDNEADKLCGGTSSWPMSRMNWPQSRSVCQVSSRSERCNAKYWNLHFCLRLRPFKVLFKIFNAFLASGRLNLVQNYPLSSLLLPGIQLCDLLCPIEF